MRHDRCGEKRVFAMVFMLLPLVFSVFMFPNFMAAEDEGVAFAMKNR